MSKIIITECRLVEKPGKTAFYACKDSVGNKMSCWDKDIADLISANLNRELEITLKTSGNFINIRAVEGMVKGNIEINPSLKTPVDPVTDRAPEVVKSVPLSRPLKDDSIVAQVFVKGAVQLAEKGGFDNMEDLGKYLCGVVNELCGAYRVAVDLLERD